MSVPTNDQIMRELELSTTSTEQLCDRLRELFATTRPGLAELQELVYEVNVANGWFEDERDFGTDIALLHTEVSEMFEAYRDFGTEDVYREKSSGEFASDFETDGRLNKPEGVGSEAADVLIRLLDTCKRGNIDLLGKTLEKIRFNATRGHKHGGKRV